ncbi:MAG: phosphate ABC transporter ATP-binding protein, partial [Rhodobacteraceae bacterium]|nr:phosphate ABC transporter ATP-binding protein [Paracoccaceae bacterium]
MNDMTLMEKTVETQNIKIAAKDVNVYYGDSHAIKDVNVEIEDNTVTA